MGEALSSEAFLSNTAGCFTLDGTEHILSFWIDGVHIQFFVVVCLFCFRGQCNRRQEVSLGGGDGMKEKEYGINTSLCLLVKSVTVLRLITQSYTSEAVETVVLHV